MKKNRFLTIMIIPEKDKPRRLTLSGWGIWGVGLTLASLALGVMTLIGSTVYLKHRVNSLELVELDNKILKEKFNEVGQEMAQIEARLERVDTFATKLRMMTSIEDQGRNQNSALEGGASVIPESGGGAADAFIGSDMGSSIRQASHYFPFHEEDSRFILPKLYELESRLKNVSQYSLREEFGIQGLYDLVKDQQLLLRSTPSILPTRGWLSSRFGFRQDPFTGLKRMHTGLDIATYKGSPIHAPADGKVSYAGFKPDYGHILIIHHGYGVSTRYAHTSKIMVNMGDMITRGEVIALVGTSGRTTSSHLHYEIRINEIPVDPANFILDDLGPMTADTPDTSFLEGEEPTHLQHSL